jgi:hypothetical protein
MNTPAAAPGALEAKPDNSINNPVLPPELEVFTGMRDLRQKVSKPTKPAAKVEEPVKPVKPVEKVEEPVKPVEKVEEPVKPAKGEKVKPDPEDETTDPVLRALMGEEEPKKEDPKPEGKPAEVKLPEGPIKGKEAEKAVRDAFVQQRKQFTDKITVLEAKLEAKGPVEPPKEIVEKLTHLEKENEAFKARLADQEKYVQIANVEMSEAYRSSVTQPREAIKADLIRIAKENGGTEAGVSASAIYTAIQRNDKAALTEAVSKLSEIDKVEVLGMAKDLRAVAVAEKALREHAEVASQEFSKAQTQQHEQQMGLLKKNYDETFATAKAVIQKEHPSLFKKVDGADDWNTAVDQSEAFLDRLSKLHPTQLRPSDLAALVNQTAVVPLQKLQVAKLTEEIKRLSTRLKGKYATQPAAGGKAGKGESAPIQSEGKQPETPEEFFAQRAAARKGG